MGLIRGANFAKKSNKVSIHFPPFVHFINHVPDIFGYLGDYLLTCIDLTISSYLRLPTSASQTGSSQPRRGRRQGLHEEDSIPARNEDPQATPTASRPSCWASPTRHDAAWGSWDAYVPCSQANEVRSFIVLCCRCSNRLHVLIRWYNCVHHSIYGIIASTKVSGIIVSGYWDFFHLWLSWERGWLCTRKSFLQRALHWLITDRLILSGVHMILYIYK